MNHSLFLPESARLEALLQRKAGVARFGLSSNQLKLCSASMEKSDNNGTLVCGTEMLQQRQMGEGMLVCICPADFSASSPVFVRKLEIKIDTGTDMGVFFLCKKHGIGKSKHCFFLCFYICQMCKEKNI